MENEVREKNREPNLIVFARQTFTPLQKDIFTLAVMQLETGMNVQSDLFQNQTVVVTLKMLSEVSTKLYTRLKQECKDLALKQLEISNDQKEEFDFIQPFPRIKYRKGVIELTMLADVAKSFLELKNGYAEYYIKESLSLEQFNKKRLYELLCSYKKRMIPTWTVYDDELKFLLGMEKEEYKGRPKEFATKIIGVCINAINDKTSILVKYIRQKDSQGWYTVFTVEDKKKAIPEEKKSPPKMDEKSQRLMDKLKALNVRQDFIHTIVEKHQSDCWKWLLANKENLDNKKFKNPAAVLLVHLGLVEPKIK